MRNGPKITAIYNLPLNSPILVWREGPIGHLATSLVRITYLALKIRPILYNFPTDLLTSAA